MKNIQCMYFYILSIVALVLCLNVHESMVCMRVEYKIYSRKFVVHSFLEELYRCLNNNKLWNIKFLYHWNANLVVVSRKACVNTKPT